ncbi:MAG: hypothetical protein QG586_1461, partial [Pseudomonadota bacterium]|nr:hypothetical protein [Pseudomonadota bacterium]
MTPVNPVGRHQMVGRTEQFRTSLRHFAVSVALVAAAL